MNPIDNKNHQDVQCNKHMNSDATAATPAIAVSTTVLGRQGRLAALPVDVIVSDPSVAPKRATPQDPPRAKPHDLSDQESASYELIVRESASSELAKKESSSFNAINNKMAEATKTPPPANPDQPSSPGEHVKFMDPVAAESSEKTFAPGVEEKAYLLSKRDGPPDQKTLNNISMKIAPQELLSIEAVAAGRNQSPQASHPYQNGSTHEHRDTKGSLSQPVQQSGPFSSTTKKKQSNARINSVYSLKQPSHKQKLVQLHGKSFSGPARSMSIASTKGHLKGLDEGYTGWDLLTHAAGGRWENISYRLSRRKNLIHQRRILVDVASVLALLGVLAMLVEAELFMEGFIAKQDLVSTVLLSVVTLTTVFLMLAVFLYHVAGLQLSMVDNSIEDWRLIIRTNLVAFILFELLVCLIHPPPGPLSELFSHTVISELSVLMFLRIYLAARFFVAHSSLVNNSATQSLGALNKVRIDAVFVFKALMSDKPGTLLMILMSVIFVISSWSVHTCEGYMAVYTNTTEKIPAQKLTDAMWMSAITFLTVGYGDVTPLSECGRVTAVVTGLLGVGTTALLVAVLAQKLEQSRAEKYVHAFVSRVALDKSYKNAAADVIKNVIKLWRLRHLDIRSNTADGGGGLVRPSASGAGVIGDTSKDRLNYGRKLALRVHVHGKLLQAVREMRNIKTTMAHIGESAVGIIEVNTNVAEVVTITMSISEQQEELRTRTEAMELRLTSIESKLERIAQAVVR